MLRINLRISVDLYNCISKDCYDQTSIQQTGFI